MQDTKFNVEKNGARGDGSFDNTDAIRRTIADARALGAGIIFFPPGVWKTTGRHDLPSCVSVEGVGSRDFSNCRIELVGNGGYLFKVGDHSRNIDFRSVELHTSGSDNVGVLAEGTYPNSAYMTTFSKIAFKGFRYGFDINSLPGGSQWECNLVSLTDCEYIGGTGIRCNTINTALTIVNGIFWPGNGQDGVQLDGVGLLTMINCLGGGMTPGPVCVDGKTNPNHPRTFIRLGGDRGTVNIINCASEGMQEWMRASPSAWVWPINLMGNTVQDRVIFEGANLIESKGNSYPAGSVYAKGAVRIYSECDGLFTLPDGTYVDDCGKETTLRTPFVCSDGALVMDENNPITGIHETRARHIFRDPRGAFSPPGKPLVTYESEIVEQPLARFGTSRNYFEVMRDWEGFHQFVANQADPYKGFGFNGAIEIEDDPGARPPTKPGKVRIRLANGKLQWAIYGGQWTNFG